MESKQKKYAVIGDIGGTNFRLRLVEINTNSEGQNTAQEMKEEVYMTKEYQSFGIFIRKLTDLPLTEVILAIRGLVIKGECMTDFKGESESKLA